MRKTFLVAVFSLASTTALAGAGHGTGQSQPDSDQPVARTITFEAGDMRFSPDTLDIAPGETVKFEITNIGNLEHEFVIGNSEAQAEHRKMMREMASGSGHDMSTSHHGGEQNDAASMPSVTITPGETATLVWTAPREGVEIEFACNIPGHYESGMQGDIQIKG